ncbi:MAG TPA: MFS transporter [Ktedonobacteraceae bacterium]|nr:MFS transporter [Ktedonobacteraceae bacterium]
MSTQSIGAAKNITTAVAYDPRRWLALAVLLAAQFMYILDIFIVNIALPSIQATLHASFGQAQLVVALYLLAYSVVLITGGRLGDLLGRKRMFVCGLLGFTLASGLCGLAPTPPFLILARVLQGVFGALMTPQVVAMIQVSFPTHERSTAFAIFGTVMGLAGIVGQVGGGVLVGINLFGLAWRPIFLVNVPVGALAFCAALPMLRESRASHVRHLDLVGVGLLSLGLLLLVYPLVVGQDAGWPVWTIVCLLLSLPVLGLFIGYERWKTMRDGSPLIDLELFRERAFVSGLLVTLTLYACLTPFSLVLSFFLQSGLRQTSLVAGLTFLPIAVGFFLASTLSSRVMPRLGRNILTLGTLIMGAGIVLTAVVVSIWGRLAAGYMFIPAFLLYGFGQGWLVAPLINIVLECIQHHHAGSASGVLLTMQQVAGSFGVAVIGILFFGVLRAQGKAINSAMLSDHYAWAFVIALLYLAGLLVANLLLGFLLPRRREG